MVITLNKDKTLHQFLKPLVFFVNTCKNVHLVKKQTNYRLEGTPLFPLDVNVIYLRHKDNILWPSCSFIKFVRRFHFLIVEFQKIFVTCNVSASISM